MFQSGVLNVMMLVLVSVSASVPPVSGMPRCTVTVLPVSFEATAGEVGPAAAAVEASASETPRAAAVIFVLSSYTNLSTLDTVWEGVYHAPMSEKTLTEGLRVNVSSATRKALEQVAAQDDRSVAAIIRRAIREFLERQDDGA